MYYVGSLFVGTFTNDYTPPAPSTVLSKYKWNIKLYHRSGGIKKDYLFGQNETALSYFEFELNKSGCGSGKLSLAYIDFPIDADDYVEIYYNSIKKYRGFVDVTPSIHGGDIELVPQWKRFEELVYNGSFTGKTASEILQTVIQAVDDDSLITWNAAYIDTGSTATFTVTYSYETVKKIIEDIISRLNDRYWGVTVDNIFYVRELESTLDKDLFYSSEVAYSDIEYEIDYSGIKATRSQVLKKVSGSGETTRIGEVGYGGSYPVLPIENLFRMKVDKITVPEVLSDAEALDYAYALLQSYKAIETTTVKNVILDRYFPAIGKLIRTQDKEEKQLTTVVACDSITGWTGATLDTSDYVEGTGSVYFNGVASGDGMEYNFNHQKRYTGLSKIGFMIKSAESGRKLSVKITSGTNYTNYGYSNGTYSGGVYSDGEDIAETEQAETSVINTIYIPSANVWHYIEFEVEDPIVSIEFYFNSAPTASCKVNVDRIQVFRPFKKQYEDNIVQANFAVSKSGETVSMKLNSYDPKANDKIFDLEAKIKILEQALEA